MIVWRCGASGQSLIDFNELRRVTRFGFTMTIEGALQPTEMSKMQFKGAHCPHMMLHSPLWKGGTPGT
jgi:hypothetical protein